MDIQGEAENMFNLGVFPAGLRSEQPPSGATDFLRFSSVGLFLRPFCVFLHCWFVFEAVLRFSSLWVRV